MNIGFYDPISERWIKPRPEPEREEVPCMSLGEALIAATEAAVVKARNERIWALLKQTAEGCNAAPVSDLPSAPIFSDVNVPDYAPESTGYILYGVDWASSVDWVKVFDQGYERKPIPTYSPPSEPECEPVESLGYVYWKPKVAI